MTDIIRVDADFFLHGLRYDVDELVVVLEVGGVPRFEVIFAPPRAFRVFCESDAPRSVRDGRLEPLLTGKSTDVGVFASDASAYLSEYREHVRPSEPEATYALLIATPQECVEVIYFEKPEIRLR